ncbi:MAG: ChbG/HpnK family deacetylase, partial [Bdellovibrionota bacterium]
AKQAVAHQKKVFDLTHGANKSLRQTLLGGRDVLQAEFDRQLARLRSVGVEVTYIDGHQHVHLLPTVIDVLADTLRSEGLTRTRIPFDRRQWTSRRPFLNWLCLYARAKLPRELARESCVYPQASDFADVETFARRLIDVRNAEVIDAVTAAPTVA